MQIILTVFEKVGKPAFRVKQADFGWASIWKLCFVHPELQIRWSNKYAWIAFCICLDAINTGDDGVDCTLSLFLVVNAETVARRPVSVISRCARWRITSSSAPRPTSCWKLVPALQARPSFSKWANEQPAFLPPLQNARGIYGRTLQHDDGRQTQSQWHHASRINCGIIVCSWRHMAWARYWSHRQSSFLSLDLIFFFCFFFYLI